MSVTVCSRDGAVLTCAATACSLNRAFACSAVYVVVSPQHPVCEMFTSERGECADGKPLVLLCRTTMCAFNREQRCLARGVTFDRHEGHADCATFRT